MKQLILLLLLLSLSIFAEQEIEHLNPSCENLKRLDAKGEVLENHPIQHQGDLSTCYANTASLMFYSKYKKDNPDTDLEQISWLSLAQENKKHLLDKVSNKSITQDVFKRGGWINQIYESVKNKNLCGIPAKKWSNKEFNSSLESNAYLFEQIMNKYEKLFNDNSTASLSKEDTQYISSSCFDSININFDEGLKKNLNKARHVEKFSIFWKYLKKPQIENLKRFKDYYMTHIFTSTFKNKESNALNFISSDSFFAGPSEVLIQSELENFVDPTKMKQFKSDFYSNAVEIADAQEKVFSDLKRDLNKQFTSCIEESLQIDPLSTTLSCNQQTKDQAQNILNFTSYAAREGLAPSFLKEILTMKTPLRTKQDILSQFMKSAYSNCKYPIKNDWTVVYSNRDNLDSIANKSEQSTVDFSFDVYDSLINLNLVGSISVDNNFLQTPDNISKESTGTHAMAVIGSASGCKVNEKENQKCILVQNSHGLNTEAEETKGTKYSNYPTHMIPAFRTKEAYQSGGETIYDENLGYGKFWLCDPKVISEYMTGLGAIK